MIAWAFRLPSDFRVARSSVDSNVNLRASPRVDGGRNTSRVDPQLPGTGAVRPRRAIAAPMPSRPDRLAARELEFSGLPGSTVWCVFTRVPACMSADSEELPPRSPALSWTASKYLLRPTLRPSTGSRLLNRTKLKPPRTELDVAIKVQQLRIRASKSQYLQPAKPSLRSGRSSTRNTTPVGTARDVAPET